MDETLIKAQRLGKLLALSPLADEIKDVIVERADQLTLEVVNELIASLEREQVELIGLERLFRDHEAEEEKIQTQLEQEGQKIAQEVVDSFLVESLKSVPAG